MLENAKMYNQDESQIYKDAVDLQVCHSSASLHQSTDSTLLYSKKHECWPSRKRRSPIPTLCSRMEDFPYPMVSCTTASCGKLVSSL